MAVNFPDSPSNGDTFTSGALTFTFNGEAWKLDPSSGTKGEKGQKGEVGVTGDKGQKGQKGEVGDKGQKGEIGATGGTGGTGQKGQKGEVGATGAGGSTGTKGQKGEVGDKGQKGEVGATGTQTFTVTNNGSSNYIIDGQNNPTLTLVRGFTYTFNVNASGHPFYIKTSATIGTGNQYTTGVTNNGVQVGTLTFVVPSNAPTTLYYICQYHLGMAGTINTVENGQKGEKGQKGEVGATGGTGDKGSTGDKGQKGQKGEVGATGGTGGTGSTGAKGQKGEVGAQGSAASSMVKQVREATSTGQSGFTSTSFQDKVSLTVSGISNNSRMVVIASYTISTSTPFGSGWTGQGRCIKVGGDFEGEEIINGHNGYGESFYNILYDSANGAGSRTYTIQARRLQQRTVYISNAKILAIELGIGP